MFLGHAAATKTLIEIACRQPVGIEQLAERELVTAANLGCTVRRLVALGLVRRFRKPEHDKRFALTLDDRHPLAGEVRAVLRSIARRNGLQWKPSSLPPDQLAVREGSNVTGLRILGEDRESIWTLLGSPNRTKAILLLGHIKATDSTTVARICGVDVHADMQRLLDPIEADGVARSKMVGSIRLYSLAAGPWARPLEALAAAVVAQDPRLSSLFSAAKVMMVSGGYSNRVHLRRHLRIADPNGPNSRSAE